MTDTYKHQKAWKLYHSSSEEHSLFETKTVGQRFGRTRRMWARVKVKLRRAWRHKFKKQTPVED